MITKEKTYKVCKLKSRYNEDDLVIQNREIHFDLEKKLIRGTLFTTRDCFGSTIIVSDFINKIDGIRIPVLSKFSDGKKVIGFAKLKNTHRGCVIFELEVKSTDAMYAITSCDYVEPIFKIANAHSIMERGSYTKKIIDGQIRYIELLLFSERKK